MDVKKGDLILGKEVYQIVGAAMEVANVLGCGFLESVYQEVLEMEFIERGIPYVSQKRIGIRYKGRPLVREYIADFVCHDQVIVEIKAITAITGVEQAQLINYLKATSLPVGVIFNFGGTRLEWQRFVYTARNREYTRIDAKQIPN